MTFFEVSPLCNFNVIESFTELSRIVLMRHGMEKIWRPNRGVWAGAGQPCGPQTRAALITWRLREAGGPVRKVQAGPLATCSRGSAGSRPVTW